MPIFQKDFYCFLLFFPGNFFLKTILYILHNKTIILVLSTIFDLKVINISY